MGSELVYRKAHGRNMQEAFKSACEEDNDYYGHQEGYSGGIHTCDLHKDVTPLLKTKKMSALNDYISDNCDKREVWGYCIKEPVLNKNKVKSQVNVTPQKGTRKWVTIYKAVTAYEHVEVARDISQTACIKKAREYVEKNLEKTLEIIIAKELVGSNARCASITYKKATNEKLGLYQFVGWAAC